jgi:hypothetical protein
VEHLESYDDGTSREWVAKRAKEFVNIEYKGTGEDVMRYIVPPCIWTMANNLFRYCVI